MKFQTNEQVDARTVVAQQTKMEFTENIGMPKIGYDIQEFSEKKNLKSIKH
jgi:hypothetical protein